MSPARVANTGEPYQEFSLPVGEMLGNRIPIVGNEKIDGYRKYFPWSWLRSEFPWSLGTQPMTADRGISEADYDLSYKRLSGCLGTPETVKESQAEQSLCTPIMNAVKTSTRRSVHISVRHPWLEKRSTGLADTQILIAQRLTQAQLRGRPKPVSKNQNN